MSTNPAPVYFTPQIFSQFVREEDDECGIQWQEPEFPRDRSRSKQIVNTRNVDDKKSQNQGNGDGEEQK